MRLAITTVTTALALTLGACGHKEDTTVVTNTGTETVDTGSTVAPAPSGGQSFANAAAASDAFEIATSRLALEKGSSATVKKFAQKMIDAHTASTAKLKAAAGAATPAITPDATLTADQQATLTSLGGLSGAAFDKAYAAAQLDGHQKTLDALRAYSAGGDVASLKNFATGLAPTVAAHLNMAKGLKA